MDKIHEYKLMHHRRIESIIKDIEETEAKTNEASEAIRRQVQSNKTSIGPANDLLRYLYILEQQCQTDSNEIRMKTRGDVLEYLEQFQPDDEIDEDTEDDADNDDLIPSPTQVHLPSQTLPAVSSSSQVSPAVSSPLQEPLVVSSPLQVPSIVPSSSSLSPVTDPNHIRPKTLVQYEKLLLEAKQYEERYVTVDLTRKNELKSFVRVKLNIVRENSLEDISNEIFQFLNGQVVKSSDKIIPVSTHDERLLCLSILATSLLQQLLGGDLNDVKTKVFLPLISKFMQSEPQKEFRIIFLDCLYKHCPYTVPLYPERKPTMNDHEYFIAKGYKEKKDGNTTRLETDEEFLNRMVGLIRLFCKLLVNRIPSFETDTSLEWRWCSDVSNLPPIPNLTPLLLRVFLDEAGSMMMKEYSTQFLKIIKAIRKNLETIGKGTSPGELSRLQQELDKFPK